MSDIAAIVLAAAGLLAEAGRLNFAGRFGISILTGAGFKRRGAGVAGRSPKIDVSAINCQSAMPSRQQ